MTAGCDDERRTAALSPPGVPVPRSSTPTTGSGTSISVGRGDGALDHIAQAVDEAILGTPDPATSDRKLHALTDFGGLYIRHRGALMAHARRFLSDPHDIDDVVQETFLKLFLAMPEVETEGQALAFARRILTNLCIDRYRAAQRRPATVGIDLGESDYLLAEDEPTDPVVQAEDAVVVREALARLSPLHREALIKREIEEKSLPVIAEELGIPEESVKHLLFRARRMLRRLLVGTSVDPAAPMTAPEIMSVANQRLARAALRSTNVIIALLVAVVAVAGGMRGISRSSQPASDAVGPGGGVLLPVPDHQNAGPTGHRTATAHHTGSAGSAPAVGTPQHGAITITGPQPSRHHPVRHSGSPSQSGGGSAPPSNPDPDETSPNYVLGGSVRPTGPVAIGNQVRVNQGTSSATSVSRLAAPVGAAHFVVAQALISTTSSADPQMQLTPQLQDAAGDTTSLPVAASTTTETLDPETMTYGVQVNATLGVGNDPQAPASLQIEMTYDSSMQHVLAETLTVAALDINQPVVATTPGPPVSSSGASSSPAGPPAGDSNSPSSPATVSDPAEARSS